jgi:general secretion pathway protein J
VRSRGFTLLELLVAMAVLALVGALGYRGLNSVLDAEARLQAETRRWSDVSLLSSQLSEDLTMAIGRTTRDGAAMQSVPRRVGYRLRDGALEYLVWPDLDAAPGSAPAAYELLGDVADLQWQALDADGRWTTEWPAQRPATALPRAVSVRIVLAGGESITRILPLQ